MSLFILIFVSFFLTRSAFPFAVSAISYAPAPFTLITSILGMAVFWLALHQSSRQPLRYYSAGALYFCLHGLADCWWLGLGYSRISGASLVTGLLLTIALTSVLIGYGLVWCFVVRTFMNKSTLFSLLFLVLTWTAFSAIKAERFSVLYTNWLTGLPFGEIAYVPALGMLADYIAPYLGSHAVTFVAVLFAAMIANWLITRNVRLLMLAALLLSALSFLASLPSPPLHASATKLRAALLQTNFPSSRLLNSAPHDDTAIALFNKLQSVGTEHALDVLVTPETFFPFAVDLDRSIQPIESGTPLILGAPTLQHSDSKETRSNSAVFLKGKKVDGVYHKRYPVPLLEQDPAQSFPFADRLLLNPPAVIVRGKANQIPISIRPETEAAVSICFDDFFRPSIFDRPLAPVNLFISIGSFDSAAHTPGPSTQLQYSLMRAREYGVPIIRAANYGVSGYGTPSSFKELPEGKTQIAVFALQHPAQPHQTFYAKFHSYIDGFWILSPIAVWLIHLSITAARKRDSISQARAMLGLHG